MRLFLPLLAVACTSKSVNDSALPAIDSSPGETATGATDSTDSVPDDSGDDTAAPDPECPAVSDTTTTLLVTDIDETLTTLDSEFLAQLADPTYVPEMRPDANTLMQGYYALGYRILYVTARGARPRAGRFIGCTTCGSCASDRSPSTASGI